MSTAHWHLVAPDPAESECAALRRAALVDAEAAARCKALFAGPSLAERKQAWRAAARQRKAVARVMARAAKERAAALERVSRTEWLARATPWLQPRRK